MEPTSPPNLLLLATFIGTYLSTEPLIAGNILFNSLIICIKVNARSPFMLMSF
jgi:hypothetical protein